LTRLFRALSNAPQRLQISRDLSRACFLRSFRYGRRRVSIFEHSSYLLIFSKINGKESQPIYVKKNEFTANVDFGESDQYKPSKT
jgi:hypothetical protein